MALLHVCFIKASSQVHDADTSGKDTVLLDNPKAKQLIKNLLRLKAEQDSVQAPEKGDLDEMHAEFDQLIVHEVVSKAGIDFQEIFYSLWSWPTNIEGQFLITISEKPFRGTSTQLEIRINDYMVFQNFVQPRYDVLEAMAQQAVQVVGNYLANYNELVKQLEGDDLSGSGIY